MKIHPLCQCVPAMTNHEFDDLVADMKANGYDNRFPVVLLDGAILDGRHRWKAAAKAEVTAKTIEYKGDDPAGFVLRSNRRRNLTASQRAAMAAELLPAIELEAAKREKSGKADPGGNLPPGSRAPRSTEIAAKESGASEKYVRVAKAVREKSPSTFQALKDGKVSVAQAAATLKAPQKPKDGRGQPVSLREVVTALKAVPEFEQVIRDAQALKRGIKVVAALEGGAELAGGIEKEITVAIDNIVARLKGCVPFTTCPYMPNCETKTCKTCRGTKWITEQVWDRLPKEIRR